MRSHFIKLKYSLIYQAHNIPNDMNNHKIAEVLNDLVQINTDRIAVYENAHTKIEEGYKSLEPLFNRMIDESKEYVNALISEISKLDVRVVKSAPASGKIYRSWADVKATLTGGDERPTLNTCETLENATQLAYEDALDEEGLSAEIHSLISKQKAALLGAHGHIKQLLEIASY